LNVFQDTPENPNSIMECAGIFERCTTLAAIGQEMVKMKSACGSGQFVYFHLNALLKKDPEFKTRFLEEAKEKLCGLGITQEDIQEFFQCGTEPGLILTFKHERPVVGHFTM
jgi:hypothetical protein